MTQEQKAKPRKILIGITKGTWGGAQNYVYQLVTSIPKDEYAVSVVLGQKGKLSEILQKEEIAVHEIHSLQRDISFGLDFKTFFELYQLFKKEGPDVVHLNSSKMGGIGSFAARFAGVPKIIFTAHGWPFWEKRNFFSRGIIWFFSWLTALFSHHIIVISDYDLSVARQMPFVKRKVVRVYNGIQPIQFFPRETDTEKIHVLTNGELIDNKNLFVAIEAVAQAKQKGANIDYAIMSDGELRADLERYITKHMCGEFITLLGFISEGKRRYKNYDIFFLPSKKEGLPYVLLEAGLAGLPVIASNVGGIPEIITHEENGLLYSPADTQKFSEALFRLSKDSSECARLGKNLKEKVERNFSFSKMLEKTLSVYRS
jgi:glycosyltransferase involved in cell wall biosynthesis